MECCSRIEADSGLGVEAERPTDRLCRTGSEAGAGSRVGRQIADLPQTEDILDKAESNGQGAKSNREKM